MSDKRATELSDRFLQAKESIDWANDAIAEFHEIADAFFKTEPGSIITYVDPQSRKHIQKLTFEASLPKELARKASEALHRTRDSFDQAIYAARTALGENPEGGGHYPWADSRTGLETRLQKAKVDKRLWSTIEAHEPYMRSKADARGDDEIRTLAKIANRKHTVGIAVLPDPSTIIYPRMRAKGPMTGYIGSLGKWDAKKNEAVIAEWIGDMEVDGDYTVSFQIVFKDTGLSQPVNVGGGLRRFSAKAQEVVETLEARCREILG